MTRGHAFGRAAWVRVAPFAWLVLLAVLAQHPGVTGGLLDTGGFEACGLVGLALLLGRWRREYTELSAAAQPTWREFALAALVGALVFACWIQLDQPWMRLGEATAGFRPVDAQGDMIWPLVALRLFAAPLLLPLASELFWRSFLMRWFEAARFEEVAPQRVGHRAILLSTFAFALTHTLWLGAIVAGLAWAWLYRRTAKLWVAVIAHAVTQAALAAWVLVTGAWGFW